MDGTRTSGCLRRRWPDEPRCRAQPRCSAPRSGRGGSVDGRSVGRTVGNGPTVGTGGIVGTPRTQPVPPGVCFVPPPPLAGVVTVLGVGLGRPLEPPARDGDGDGECVRVPAEPPVPVVRGASATVSVATMRS